MLLEPNKDLTQVLELNKTYPLALNHLTLKRVAANVCERERERAKRPLCRYISIGTPVHLKIDDSWDMS